MDKTARLTISTDAPGAKLFMLGNEAIARGAIEAGVQVVGAYPGTPSTEIAETLIDLANQFDIKAEWSVNEKVAFGVAMGASICGLRAMAIMKHVGVNVASDLLMTATYLGTTSGLVLVEAEDPGQWSSSDEQDNRFLAEEAYLPVLEPSSAQEAKDMTRDSFQLSEKFQQPFMIRSVTRIGHSRADVSLGTITRERKAGHFEKDTAKWVMLPANARKHRSLMVARLARIKAAADSSPYNQATLAEGAKLGIITAGISYSYTLEALSLLRLREKVSVLKIGTPYPLPENKIKAFLSAVHSALVVEELEPYLENHVKAIAQDAGINIKIHGKDFLPVVGELSTRKVTEAISKLSAAEMLIDFAAIDKMVKEVESLLPLRPPSLCAGCPHRASHYAINLAVEELKKETGVETIRPGDIGCYCLGANAPLNAVDTSTCMGSGFDLANGIAKAVDVPVIAHLGDSTFFHSGIAPMINAVFNQTRITMVVLDNLTTAMTGSQANPGVGYNAGNIAAPQIHPEDIARASGVKFVEVVDPSDLKTAAETMLKAIRFEGPSVVVFRSPCSILDQRDRRARGEKIVPYKIESEKCIALSPPFCTAACPLHIDVRGYVNLAREGKYTEALNLIQEKLPFPAILGRICTHPCQSQCKRAEVDDAVAIMALKRAAADFGKSLDKDLLVPQERLEKVAVVGGGPAGLIAAYDLRKMGYQVTIFEAHPVLGGMLSIAIPEQRLPADISRMEIDRILKMGIGVKLNTRVGIDIHLKELREKYQAVFVAIGAHVGKTAGIENDVASGVVKGIDFLKDVRLGQKIEPKERVAIIGGGNVAVDCARTCVRLGFKQVTVVYRRSRLEMPALPEEVHEAEKEGVKFLFLAGPVKVLSDDGVTGLKCLKMKLGEPDSSGRREALQVPGSEFDLAADLLILAVGEVPDLSLLEGGKTPLRVQGDLLIADPLTLQTGLAGVFAGGDAVTGPATVIAALAAGRKAAVSIDRFLKGEPLEPGRESEGLQTSLLVVDTAGVSREKRLDMPLLSIDLRKDNLREVELGYDRKTAGREAGRCLSCGCQLCIKKLGCPAIVLEGEEVVIDSSQCPGCGICAQVCPAEAIVPQTA